MKLSNDIKKLMVMAGFSEFVCATFEETRKKFAGYRLESFPDQWEMRVAEKLDLHRCNREQLVEIST